MALRWVALDAMGVLYAANGLVSMLTRFAHQRGATMPEAEVRLLYLRASEGLVDSAGVWAELGIPGDAWERDGEFLRGRELMPGARGFLDAMDADGVSVACITNDVAAWSIRLRRMHGLEDEIGPWVVSAEVGVRKPAAGIYRAFLAKAGCSPGECLFVDDRVENLDAALDLGMATAWFSQQLPPDGLRHVQVTSFAELSALIGLMKRTQATTVA